MLYCAVCGKSIKEEDYVGHETKYAVRALAHGYILVDKYDAPFIPDEATILTEDKGRLFKPFIKKIYYRFLRLPVHLPRPQLQEVVRAWLSRFATDEEALALSEAMYESLPITVKNYGDLYKDEEVWVAQVAELLDLPVFW